MLMSPLPLSWSFSGQVLAALKRHPMETQEPACEALVNLCAVEEFRAAFVSQGALEIVLASLAWLDENK